jgi:predicted DNA-binding transcriptional regulator AlpA
MPDTYLADITLAKRYGIARNTIWRWHRERPDFPRAIRLSTNCTRWKLSEVIAWEALKAEAAA